MLISYDVLSGDEVVPTRNPERPDELESVLVFRVLREETGKRLQYAQLWTKDEVMEVRGEGAASTTPNPYGVIPFVLFIEEPDDIDPAGTIPLYNVLQGNKAINDTWSGIANLLRMQAHSQVVARGVSDAEEIPWGESKMIKLLNPDSEISLLTPSPAIADMLETIRQNTRDLYETARVPDPVEKKHTEALSGVALAMLMSPMLSYRQEKAWRWQQYEEGLAELTAHVARVHGMLDVNPWDLGFSIQYSKYFLAFQQAERREKAMKDLEVGAASQVDMYLVDNPGSSREEALEALLRAKAEREALESGAGQPTLADLLGEVESTVTRQTMQQTATERVEAQAVEVEG
jgi:hypothetical protein